MDWNVVAMITFSCVAANHLGMIAAVEQVIKHRVPIVNCPKCFTFWGVATYGIFAHEDFFVIVAAAFLFAYASLWLRLFMAYIDKKFDMLYGKIYPTDDGADDGA